MAVFDISFVLGFVAGGALIWFAKDKVLLLVKGGNVLAADLRAKAAKIEGIL